MRSGGAFSIIFLEFLSVTTCTIDMNIAEFEYIANHLTSEECRLLVASLHFSEPQQKPSEDVPCIALLIKWNDKEEGTTHEVVAFELRRIGRKEVADWLGATVFNKISKDLDDALTKPFFVKEIDDKDKHFAVYKDSDNVNKEIEWNTLDSVLFMLLVGTIIAILLTCSRLLVLSCTKVKIPITDEEEMSNLIRHAVDDEQEICKEESESMIAEVKK